MSLTAGSRLGHYEIIERIGAGGMGEVYKARDPRLNRTVAVKVLLEHVSDNREARMRFEREAQTVAGLNHPHICVVYDVGHHDNTDFLVMELLEGETLARRLERGPLPLAQALKYAMEIADALDKAHRRGVTHRDLKPANIMLTHSGAKLLDFGLAKLRPSSGISGLSLAPTIPDVTAEGTILGSLHYMSPEQLEGGEADPRTDIFAFGAVLYEMVTGQRAFQGKSAVSVMSAILKDTPRPASTLQPVTPAALDRVIATCLAKDREDRWQSAGDLCRELRWIEESPPTAKAVAASPAVSQRALPWTVAALLVCGAVLLTALVAWLLPSRSSSGNLTVANLSVTLEAGERLAGAQGLPLALSPDGQMIAYASQRAGETRQLYFRTIGNPEVRAVPGSDGASNPFFSPDGKWIAFFSRGKLKSTPVLGGRVETLCDAGAGLGGSWSDDTIYFARSSTSGLWSVAASGGTPKELTTLDRAKGEVSHRFPQVLPGGTAILFTVWTGPGWDETELQVLTLAGGERHTVVQGARTGRYATSGHVVYSRNGPDTLLAVPFDLDRLQVSGSPIVLPESVRNTSEGGEFAISDSGTLAYVQGNPQRYQSRLVWVDRNGAIEPLSAPPRPYQEPVISPDGRQVVFSIAGPAYDLWVYDIARSALMPLVSAGSSQAPVWTPDGKHVIYRATRKGFRNLVWRAVDGSGDETRLTEGLNNQTPGSLSPDGKVLLFQESDSTTSSDIWELSREGNRQRPLLNSFSTEANPHLSHDGRWLAYQSDESGRPEIWVRPFPTLDNKWKISTDGGIEPVWSPDGKELFFRNGDKLLSVQITSLSPFTASPPHVLFEGRFQFSEHSISCYEVSPDGRRFLMVQPADADRPVTQFHVVVNWFAELRR